MQDRHDAVGDTADHLAGTRNQRTEALLSERIEIRCQQIGSDLKAELLNDGRDCSEVALIMPLAPS